MASKAKAQKKAKKKSSKKVKTQLYREDRFYKAQADQQRTEFQRDRDRLLYSPEFRRLAGVTQVVHVQEGHVFHNRLTHSLKVAQVARRLAEYLLKSTDSKVIQEAGGLDPDVVETAALAHDIGHPPFGHIAEDELNKLLIANKCFDGFEGNAQSFRVITNLSIRSNGEMGLNLTRASLNAVLKYPWKKEGTGKAAVKWGFYSSEKEFFEFARAMEPSPNEFKSLEAEVMDWADDIAYSVHDVDDFYRAGLIPFDQILKDTEERERFFDYAIPAINKHGENFKKTDAAYVFDTIANLFPELTEPFMGSKSQRAALSAMTTMLLTRYIFGPKPKPFQIEKKSDSKHVKIDKRIELEIKLLKKVMGYYVYVNPALVGQQYGQRKVIRELFEFLNGAISDAGSNATILPEPYRQYVLDCENNHAGILRVIADFISSLTEQQALVMHKRLIGLEPGSIRELVIR